jgi:hypothetical protein
MKAINYCSFEEIDQHLKILWLQKEIAHENIKLGLKKTKNNLYPQNLLGGVNNLGGTIPFIQSLLITFLTDWILKKLNKRNAIH